MDIKAKTIYFLLLVLASFSISVSMGYAANVPLLDDYNLCLQFISEFLERSTSEQRLLSIFSFNNGHPTVTQKLMFLLDWTVYGEVNFRHFIFINNVVHFLILIALFRLFLLLKVQDYFFIPIALVIAVPVFTLNNWSSSFMHLSTICCVLFSFYYLSKGNRVPFWKATLLAILASLSSGAGVLVFFASVPILWQQYDRRYWIAWFTVAMITIIYYFWAYTSIGSVADDGETSILTYLVNYLVFYGSIFKAIYNDHHVWSVVFGMLLICSLLYILVVKVAKFSEVPVLSSLLIFAILIGFLTTIMRSQFGLGATTAYRYRLYQALPVALLLMAFAKFWSHSFRSNFYLILFCFILMYGFRWENSLKQLKSLEVQLKMGAMIFVNQGNTDELTFRNQNQAEKILKKAKDLSIFRLNSNYPLSFKIDLLSRELPSISVDFSHKIINDQFIYLRGKTSLKSGLKKDTEIRIGYLDGDKLFHFPTMSMVDKDDLLPEPSESFIFFQQQPVKKVKERSFFVVHYSILQGVLAMEMIQD